MIRVLGGGLSTIALDVSHVRQWVNGSLTIAASSQATREGRLGRQEESPLVRE